MKTYTIVRNGTISQAPRGPHKCGFSRTSKYPYRVEMTVSGRLRAPDFFIIRNEDLHTVVLTTFKAKRLSESCERMCDDICHAILAMMNRQTQWTVERLHVALTGTDGLALLSCDWQRPLHLPPHRTLSHLMRRGI